MDTKERGKAITNLRAIREHRPCGNGWELLLGNLRKTHADDEPLSLATILESNGIEDAIWCLRTLGEEWRQEIIGFACDCAESVLPTFEAKFPKDTRPRQAIETARVENETMPPEEGGGEEAALAAQEARVEAWSEAIRAAAWSAEAARAARKSQTKVAEWAAEAAWAARTAHTEKEVERDEQERFFRARFC